MRTVPKVLLPVLVAGIFASVRVPNQLSPRIDCSPVVREGSRFYCSANLEYPPDATEYIWAAQGDCTPDASTGQSILLTTPARAISQGCTVRLTARDAATGRLAGSPAEERIPIRTQPAIDLVPEQQPPANLQPTGKSTVTGHPESRVRLEVTAWPDPGQRAIADAAPVQGRALGTDPGLYKVAVYSLASGGWSLQGVSAVNPATGKWDVVARLAGEYAAVLVTRSYEPEPDLPSLPKTGNNIIDVKKSN